MESGAQTTIYCAVEEKIAEHNGRSCSINITCVFFLQKQRVSVYYFWVIAPVVLIHSACGFDKMIVLLILKTLLTVLQVLLRLQGKGTATPSRECGGCQEVVGHLWRTHWAWEELDRAQLLEITMVLKYSKVLIMLIHRLHVSIMEFSQATLHAGGEGRRSKMKLSSLTSYPMRMTVSWSSVCI